MELLACWMILCLFRQALSKGTCSRNGMITCCSGYTWNKTSRSCERCPPGYTGVDCIFPCGYPNYGIGCDQTCECTEHMCDFTFGCKSVSKPESTYTTENENRKGQITSTSDYITKTTSKEGQIEVVTGTSPVPWFNYWRKTDGISCYD